jgi:acetyltransferase-like isoleucine patch superfamily enzyme
VHVERGARIDVARGARVILEDGCSLGERCRIDAAGGTVRVGRNARIGERAVLVSVAGIEIGTGADIGDWAVIADADPAFADRPMPITIGDGARVGLHAAIVAGGTVAAGEQIAPYATRGAQAPGGADPRGQVTRAPRRSA